MIANAQGLGRDLKNIRQIGAPAEGDRIYIENAAYARIHEEAYEERRVFIFMGHTECEQGIYMTFVEAAIPVRDMEFSKNLPRWSTHAWSDVFREVKRSYENSIIVGWAMDCKGYPPRLTAELEAIHREQFGGAHQVLFLMDSLEGEEYFYLHKGNRLQPKNGFYIYYARELHEVRIPDVTIELPRRGSLQSLPDRNGKKTIDSVSAVEVKQPSPEKKKERTATSYAMVAAVALLLVLVGAGVWQQRIHIPGLEQTVETIGQKINHAAEPAEVLVGSEIKATEEATQTISEPLQLIPIEEIPAGEVKKAGETQTPATEETTQEESQQEESQQEETKQETQAKEPKQQETIQQAKETQEEKAEQKSAQPQETLSSAAAQNYYIVREGDTLSGICQNAYGSLRKLKQLENANQLENSDDIHVGQKLLLP